MNSPLISARELADHSEWRTVDCRHDLKDVGAGETAFATGHIPGATFLHLDRDLSAPATGTNGRHPLPDPTVFAACLGRIGITPETTVIAYDDQGGIYASRLWWMLRWLGHKPVYVLDGGLTAWLEHGGALEQGTRSWPATTYPPALKANLCIDVGHIESDFVRAEEATRGLLLDARSPDRFAGQNETLDPVGGHIPGARNRFFQNNLNSNSKRFRPAGELRTEFLALLGSVRPEQVIHQCGSGVTACHNLLAMEHSGLAGSRLYAGSWSEWCADPKRPVVTGSRA